MAIEITEEKIAWLRLLKTPGIGRVTFFHLLEVFKSAISAIDGFEQYLASFRKKNRFVLCSRESAMSFLENCDRSHTKLVFSCDSAYPKEFLLAQDFAPVLFCKGNLSLFSNECLAVVGSRAASFQGVSFTKKIIKDLSSLTIVSGFARGIDFAAHEAALSNGTIAVLGCGVNFIYPSENKDLYSKILDHNGLIISEIGLADSPKPNFFAYRNRVISGLSKGVLVVEAAMNSGSLITAKYAAEQGKNVFAVPGHPYDTRSQGTNYLIKNGAVLVRNSDDVLSEFQCYSVRRSTDRSSIFGVAEESDIESVKRFILERLGKAKVTISEIVSLSPHSVSVINTALAELDLSGDIIIEHNLVSKAV